MPAPSWDAAAVAQMTGQRLQAAFFLRIAASPTPARMWSGVGDYPLPSDTVEPGGATYKGLGGLRNAPKLQQLINGVAEKVDFSLSGVDATALGLAADNAAGVQNADANLGLAFLDPETLQPVSPTAWLWFGTVQTLKIQRKGAPGAVVRSITLSVGSAFVRRRRPSLAYFTDAGQQAQHPGDTFCQRVVQYLESVVKIWPVF